MKNKQTKTVKAFAQSSYWIDRGNSSYTASDYIVVFYENDEPVKVLNYNGVHDRKNVLGFVDEFVKDI